jgi:hypothetical protein
MLDRKGWKAKLAAGSRLTCGISLMLLICVLSLDIRFRNRRFILSGQNNFSLNLKRMKINC